MYQATKVAVQDYQKKKGQSFHLYNAKLYNLNNGMQEESMFLRGSLP